MSQRPYVLLNWLGVAPFAAIICTPLAALAAASATQTGETAAFTDPGEIDRAVSEFTGAAIGEVGGARVPADRRLRLAACSNPLQVAWHGRNRATVQVECPGAQSWRIFVATLAPAQAPQSAPAVDRGDPVTIVIRGRGFTVQQTGEATESGAIGDWIGIRTTSRGEPIRARIERPGLAVIPGG
jgi:flagella basal body P-ring formation protein FlgA